MLTRDERYRSMVASQSGIPVDGLDEEFAEVGEPFCWAARAAESSVRSRAGRHIAGGSRPIVVVMAEGTAVLRSGARRDSIYVG